MGRVLMLIVRPLLSSARHIMNERQVPGKTMNSYDMDPIHDTAVQSHRDESVAEDVGSGLWKQPCTVHAWGEDRIATVKGAFWHPRY